MSDRPLVLIPGRIHSRVRARLSETFELLEVADASATEATPEQLSRNNQAWKHHAQPRGMLAPFGFFLTRCRQPLLIDLPGL